LHNSFSEIRHVEKSICEAKLLQPVSVGWVTWLFDVIMTYLRDCWTLLIWC